MIGSFTRAGLSNPITKEANPVVFQQGMVDFTPWAVGEPLTVPGIVGTAVNANADMQLIYRAIAEARGLSGPTAAKEWLYNTAKLSPHHVGGDKVILVPQKLHATQKGGLQHTNVADMLAQVAGGLRN